MNDEEKPLEMKKRLDDHHDVLIEDEGDVSKYSEFENIELSKFNQWPHVFNLTNSIVGVSVLAMPYCLQKCGIFLGTMVIGFCSLVTKVSCHLLYKGSVLTRRGSYEAMALHAFGNNGRIVTEVARLFFLMSIVVSYMVVVGDIGPHVLADYLQMQAPTQRLRVLLMVFISLFFILPLSLVRSLDSLSVVNSISVLFYFIFVMRMLLESAPRIFDGKWSQDVYWWRPEGVLGRCFFFILIACFVLPEFFYSIALKVVSLLLASKHEPYFE
ncbi:hypothetical protein AB6A40_009433 [Gnathostoma spinigerum]|uniref:Amino acid transporter transmembrane domain-containing protein n=1 Tax=Gnathostoma spinigerum TaxID=75299 RepID=A0ABD6ERY7_9BILA